MKKLSFRIIMLATALALVSCSKNLGNTSTKEISESNTPQQEITKMLEKSNYETTIKEDVSNMFSDEGFTFSLNGDTIFVAVYENESQTKEILSNISDDGFQFTRTNSNNTNTSISIDWIDQPHFYQYKNFMIYYVGRNSDTMKILNELFGEPVIG